MFHTLRHTCASHLAMRGVDLPTLQLLMGHAAIITTMRYAHLSPDHVTLKGALMPSFINPPGKGQVLKLAVPRPSMGCQ